MLSFSTTALSRFRKREIEIPGNAPAASRARPVLAASGSSGFFNIGHSAPKPHVAPVYFLFRHPALPNPCPVITDALRHVADQYAFVVINAFDHLEFRAELPSDGPVELEMMTHGERRSMSIVDLDKLRAAVCAASDARAILVDWGTCTATEQEMLRCESKELILAGVVLFDAPPVSVPVADSALPRDPLHDLQQAIAQASSPAPPVQEDTWPAVSLMDHFLSRSDQFLRLIVTASDNSTAITRRFQRGLLKWGWHLNDVPIETMLRGLPVESLSALRTICSNLCVSDQPHHRSLYFGSERFMFVLGCYPQVMTLLTDLGFRPETNSLRSTASDEDADRFLADAVVRVVDKLNCTV
eukprot:TRINITY_DN82237_c0_g1_i1.p1 TRINITY_DN82237_c0_g1~~TRINITY_DN82237_c0_g1_i1.p1  ORF type:complete len:356 (-),score=45.22 TRINITY_DN82237_c0_g1_i1:84-1151(-)